MAIEGTNEWEKQKSKGLMSDESFHLDPTKTDPVEKLIERVGPIGALKDLVDQLEVNPQDEEIVRQIKFTINHLQSKTQH